MTGGSALLVPDSTGIGGRIKLARIASGRSIGEMAAALGMSKGTYERTESGARPARRGELIAIAELTNQEKAFFGVTSDAAAEGAILSDLAPRVNGRGET